MNFLVPRFQHQQTVDVIDTSDIFAPNRTVHRKTIQHLDHHLAKVFALRQNPLLERRRVVDVEAFQKIALIELRRFVQQFHISIGKPAMGLRGYLAAKSDAESSRSSPPLASPGLTAQESAPVVEAIRQRSERWVNLMIRMGLEQPDPQRALTSALNIGGAYILGGSIPLAPYIYLPSAQTALLISVVITLVA